MAAALEGETYVTKSKNDTTSEAEKGQKTWLLINILPAVRFEI